VYNAEKYIKKTIQCILDQTYSDWILYVVDDGSKDESVKILKSFTDPRINVFSGDDNVKLTADSNGVIVAIEKENVGPAATRNRALDVVRFSKDFAYVAYCDADDRWNNAHLAVAIHELQDIGTHMVYTDPHFVKEDGTKVTTFGVPYYEKFERENLLKQNFIYISSVVHKVECLSVGHFDTWTVPMEDYDMWLSISKSFNVKHIQSNTLSYMFKDNGSYYNDEQSKRSMMRVHIKNYVVQSDIDSLKIQLEEIREWKNIIIRSQRYEDAARARDIEKQIIAKINLIEGPQVIPGWLSVIEGDALAKYSEGKDCLEIGSFKGKSANYIAPKAKSLVCIDPFRADDGGQSQYIDYTTLQEFLANTKKFTNIIPVIGKSEDVYKQFKDGQFDMMFIDGMHDYDSVVSDIEKYWPKLKLGGHMCFHDYQKDWTGVIKAVDEYFIRPDAIYDSIAVVQKKSDLLEKQSSDESETLKEYMNNKFLLMTKLHITSEQIDKMNFYEFDEYVKSVKLMMQTDSSVIDALQDAKVDIAVPLPRVIKKIVLVSPWSHKLPNGEENPKNFPYWQELVPMIKDAGCYVIQIGVAGEALIGADEVVFNASFDKLKELLDNADTFLSVDSFFPHFANYYGKHGVVIFSQSDPNLFGYPENLNILKSTDYLRKEQFWLWTQAKFNKEAFISSKEVLDNLLGVLQLR
jgi:glycosyltransferase involved in cell wall biosynthesis